MPNHFDEMNRTGLQLTCSGASRTAAFFPTGPPYPGDIRRGDQPQPQQTAFTLIETVLALGVLAMGVLTVAALLPTGLGFPDESISREAQARVLRWAAAQVDAGTRPLVQSFDAQGWPVNNDISEAAWRATLSWPPVEMDTPRPVVVEIQRIRTNGACGANTHTHYLSLPPP